MTNPILQRRASEHANSVGIRIKLITACALVFVYPIRLKSSRIVGDESMTNSKLEGGQSGMAGRDGVAAIRFYCSRPERMVFPVWRVGDSVFIGKRIGREASVAFIFPFLSPPTKRSSSCDNFLVCSRLDAVKGCSRCNSTRSQHLKSYR